MHLLLSQADQHLVPLALESMMTIFLQRKQPIAARAAAYVKRLSSLSLSAPVPTALAFLELVLTMLSVSACACLFQKISSQTPLTLLV